ncbi:MAG: InlB B-repeat-containing protein, partial [Aliidiomarina sp.]|uniref:InlB B-repeat-containing protein n=1 Tax=Aliidiomarina sp. TaxID=1872439 RepID=UPI0025C7344B
SFTLTVDAQNGDAPVVSTVAFDSLVHLPTEPTRDWYNFVGWNSAADGAGSSYDADFTMPATDLTLYAQWQIQTFSVRFLDWDGSELVTRTVDAGSAAAAPTSPSRMGYTFVGWDVAFDEVYSSFDVTAQYNINTFTVRFLDWDGSVLSTQTVDWNTAATAPASPTRDGHTFTSWDVGFAAVTSNLDVTAQYDINTFTVRFLDWDDSVIATETVNWNEGATAPADPERDGYTFTGWSVAFDVITANLDVTAQYNINTFTVRFLDWDDSVIATETVNWNEGATAPADPTRELYEFIGWDRAFDAVTSDLDITAQYERNAFVVTATVITVDGFGVVTPMVQQVPRGGTATFEAWTSMRYRIRSVQSDCGVTFERSGRTFQFDDIRQDCEVVFEYRKVRSSIIRLLKAHGSVIQQQDDEMPENF